MSDKVSTPSSGLAADRWSAARMLLAVGLSLGCLLLAFRDVNLNGLAAALGRVSPGLLALAVAGVAANIVCKALRWRLMFPTAQTPSAGRSLSVFLVGLLVNLLAPVRLGELARVLLISRRSPGAVAYALGTIGVEKLLELATVLITVALLISRMSLPDWLLGPAQAALLAMLVAASVMLLLAWQEQMALTALRRLTGRVAFLPTGWLERQFSSLLSSLSVLRQPSILAGLLGWTLAAWLAAVATNTLVLWSLAISAPAWAALVVLVVTQVGVAAIPSAPGQVGVFHYLAVLSLSLFGVGREEALAYGIVLHLIIYVPIALLGVVSLWRENVAWRTLVDEARDLLGQRRGQQAGELPVPPEAEE
jgi:glycosyltransferase 2 family protein